MRLLDSLTRRATNQVEERSGLVELFQSWGTGPNERVTTDFASYVRDGYTSNGVVHAVINARAYVFSEMAFKYQSLSDGTVFGSPQLSLLENPWPNGSSAELLMRMMQDADLSGNAFVYRAGPDRLQRLRPDWVEIITDGAEIIAYRYTVGGTGYGKGELIFPEDMAHWSPEPDPLANYKGVSWLSSVLNEIASDTLMTRHKQKFFQNAATPNLLIKHQKSFTPEQREDLQKYLAARHESVDNAYKTLVLEGGADATVVGATMQAISFDTIQAAGENRIAAAAGVPGIVANLKEGLQAATYSNYQQAMRRFIDQTIDPLWRSAVKALEKLVPVPSGARLWYDTSDIPALRQNEKDQAEIELLKAQAGAEWVKAGFDPAAVATHFGVGFKSVSTPYFPGAALIAEADAGNPPAAKALPAAK